MMSHAQEEEEFLAILFFFSPRLYTVELNFNTRTAHLQEGTITSSQLMLLAYG